MLTAFLKKITLKASTNRMHSQRTGTTAGDVLTREVIGKKGCAHWLYDPQPVKVIKILNASQSESIKKF